MKSLHLVKFENQKLVNQNWKKFKKQFESLLSDSDTEEEEVESDLDKEISSYMDANFSKELSENVLEFCFKYANIYISPYCNIRQKNTYPKSP